MTDTNGSFNTDHQEKENSFLLEEEYEEEVQVTTKIKTKKRVTFSPSVLNGMHGHQSSSEDDLQQQQLKTTKGDDEAISDRKMIKSSQKAEDSRTCLLL